MTRKHDILVIGAGIVGAACALALSEEGLDVALIDAATPGAGVTAAGMGHVVALDENEAELALCVLSQRLWRDFHDQYPGVGEARQCGTLWVAENDHHLAEAGQRATRLGARGCRVELLKGEQVQALEPALRRGLAGGLRVASDSVVYPPSVAAFLARRLQERGGTVYLGQRVSAIGAGDVVLANGSRIASGAVVVATGPAAAALLPGVPVFGRKGHLAITDRYPGILTHQLVSMDYGQAASGPDALAVAANIQPRSTGQWLIGSSRQEGQAHDNVDPLVLGALLRAAIGLVPCLSQMNIVRAWTGMRPASADGLPLIGAHPSMPDVWLACGHEGLGVTMAFGTARLLADQIMGRGSDIDGAPYQPARFATMERTSHAG